MANDPIIITEEEVKKFKGRPPRAVADQVKALTAKRHAKEVKENRKGQIVEREKLDLFLEEYLKNGGNATQAALAVFNTTSRSSASAIGSAYLKRARDLGRVVLEDKGYGYGRMLDVATNKMLESKTPEWWDRLMKVAGYEDFFAKAATPTGNTVNIVNVQKDLTDKYVKGEVVDTDLPEEEWNEEDDH